MENLYKVENKTVASLAVFLIYNSRSQGEDFAIKSNLQDIGPVQDSELLDTLMIFLKYIFLQNVIFKNQ